MKLAAYTVIPARRGDRLRRVSISRVVEYRTRAHTTYAYVVTAGGVRRLVPVAAIRIEAGDPPA